MFLQMAIHLTVLILGTPATGQHFPSGTCVIPVSFLCPAEAANTHTLTILCPQLSAGKGLEGRNRLAESSLEKGRGLCTEKHTLAKFLSCERINDSRM